MNPIYLLTLGRYYQKYGDQQKSISVLEEAERLDPDFPEIPYSLAVSYFIADDFETAAKLLERAMRLDPKFDRAVFLLGSVRATEAKFAEAERLLTLALELQPQNPYYHVVFGMTLVTENRLTEAEEQFKKTLELKPCYARSLSNGPRLHAHWQARGSGTRTRDGSEPPAEPPGSPLFAWTHVLQDWREGEGRQGAGEVSTISCCRILGTTGAVERGTESRTGSITLTRFGHPAGTKRVLRHSEKAPTKKDR